MRTYLSVVISLLLAAIALPSSAATSTWAMRLYVFELKGDRVGQVGDTQTIAINPTALSLPDEVQAMLAEAFPGRSFELVTFPMMKVTNGVSAPMEAEGVGRFTYGMSADGASARISDATFRGASLPDVAVSLGSAGGVASVLVSGEKEFAYIISREALD